MAQWRCTACMSVNDGDRMACRLCDETRLFVGEGVGTEAAPAAAQPRRAPPPRARPRPAAAAASAAAAAAASQADVISLDDDDDAAAGAGYDDRAGAGGSGASAAAAAAAPRRLAVSSLAAAAAARPASRLDASEILDASDGEWSDAGRGAHDGDGDEDDGDDDDGDDGGAGAAGAARRSPGKRKRRTPAELAAAKRAKGAAAAARAAAKGAKAAAKEAGRLAKNTARSEGGSFAEAEIAAVLTRDLAATPAGAALSQALGAHGLAVLRAAAPGEAEVLGGDDDAAYRVAVPAGIPLAVHFVRRRVDPARPVGRGRTHGFVPGALSREPFCVRLWPDDAFLAALVAGGTDGVEAALARERRALPPGARVTYLLLGARAATVAWAAARQREAAEHAAGRRAAPPRPLVTAEALDYAALFLYVSTELEFKEAAGEREAAEYVLALTRAVARFPYELADSALGCVTKIKASGSAPGGGGGGGEGDGGGDGGGGGRAKKTPRDVWFAQLQMVPGVSAAKARAIVQRYPSFRALSDTYRSSALTTAQKQGLLEDIEGSGRKQGKLSRDLFRLFTTTDPDEVIGAGAPK
jgi:hypothetical protein